MNKINSRSQSSGQLLRILANRDQNGLIQPSQQIWPGQRRPSFTSTIRINKNAPFTARESFRSSREFELQNSSHRAQTTKRKLEPFCPIRTLTLSLKSSTPQKRRKVVQVHERRNHPIKISKILNQKLRIHENIEEMDDYVIDYMAFNFIGKVIDNPELWKAYVQKRQSVT